MPLFRLRLVDEDDRTIASTLYDEGEGVQEQVEAGFAPDRGFVELTEEQVAKLHSVLTQMCDSLATMIDLPPTGNKPRRRRRVDMP